MLGFIGLACAVEQNELIIGGEMPNSSMMTALKAANSIVSVLLAGLLYYYYYLHVLFERIVNHLRRGTPLDVKVAFPEILSKKIFWLEILLCCSHLPPMVSFEIPIVQVSALIYFPHTAPAHVGADMLSPSRDFTGFISSKPCLDCWGAQISCVIVWRS